MYRNMNHVSYHPSEDTQFDDSLTQPATPTINKGKEGEEQSRIEGDHREEKQVHDDEFRNEKKSRSHKKDRNKQTEKTAKQQTNDQDAVQTEESKRKKKERKSSATAVTSVTLGDSALAPSSPPRESASASQPTSPAQVNASSTDPSSSAAADGVFSHLLLESILEQKSVADFIGGMPDKRGTMLIRFPTTILGKSWKKRYFTLHGDCLYFHEDQHVIHPSPGLDLAAGSGYHSHGSGPIGAAINYKECKRIDIANFWIIQQDEATAGATAAAAIHANASAASSSASSSSGSSSAGAKVYGGGQPIVTNDDAPSQSSGKSASKFDEIFKKSKDSPVSSPRFSSRSLHTGSDITITAKKDSKEDGPIVRGRRRSSIVNERGSVVILLIPKDRRQDPIELTGLNEGRIADLAVLNEWVLAINARICLLNFLHSPMTLTAMSRGGREILAFLTDASATELRVQNKFSDLETVLTHFKDSLSHRTGIRIIFKNCAMTDGACIALAEILREATTMVVDLLDLSCNMLTKNSCLALHQALRANKNIKSIILDNNQIGDAGLELLVNGHPSSSPSSGIDEASDVIWSGESALHSFSCRQNQISDQGMEKFLTGIMDYLNEYDRAEQEDGPVLAGPSPHALHFSHLDFGGNCITDLGLQVVSAFLARNPSVLSLKLDSNFLTDVGVAHLNEVLRDERRQVRAIDLSSNSITSLGVGFITQALNERRGSEPIPIDLELSGNPIDTEGVGQLIAIKSHGVPAVHFTKLAVSVFDPKVIEARVVRLKDTVDSPTSSSRHHPSHHDHAARSKPVIGAISTSQQNVLSLFTPTAPSGAGGGQLAYPSTLAPTASATTYGQQQILDLFGLSPSTGSPVPPASNITHAPAASQSQPPSVPQSESASDASSSQRPATASTPKKKRKGDKKARENSTLQPQIAIGAAPTGPRVSVTRLHPPPAFTEPICSPDAPAEAPNAFLANELPSPNKVVPTNGAHLGPAAVQSQVTTANEDEDEPTQLIPGRAGEKKAKGMTK